MSNGSSDTFVLLVRDDGDVPASRNYAAPMRTGSISLHLENGTYDMPDMLKEIASLNFKMRFRPPGSISFPGTYT